MDDHIILEEKDNSFDTYQTKSLTSCTDCIFKKCCEKYKKGKRCKKCPKK